MEGLVGTTLGGQYHIEAKVGQGGMAEVFRAYQLSLGRHVAIKILPPAFAEESPDFLTRFKREATAVAQLNHPNILPVYDFGVDQGYSYIVMRYVEGGQTLRHLLRYPISPERATYLVGQIAEALSYAHNRGIIHRDVKPSNILLDSDWALLSDFGLAKFHADGNHLTKTGVGIGTAAYMSPEQSKGEEIDRRTDIYALGVILYQMLTGKIPHDADNPVSIMMQRITKPPEPPSAFNKNIPEQLEQIVLRAIATEPDYRFDSATDLAKVLRGSTSANGNVYLPDAPSSSSEHLTTNVFSTQVLSSVDSGYQPIPVKPIRPAPSWNRWATFIAVLSAVVASTAIFYGIPFLNSEAGGSDGAAVAGMVPTPTETPSPPATATPTPSATQTPTHTHTATATPATTATQTPTATASATPWILRVVVTPTDVPPTPTATPLNATFKLLSPLDLERPSYGPTTFEWIWNGPVDPDQGFEVRVWRGGENPLGAHDAIADNLAGRIISLGNDRYRLETNIENAAGVRLRGEYLWSVALVQIKPEYVDLGLQSDPALFRYEASTSGNGNSDGGIGIGFE